MAIAALRSVTPHLRRPLAALALAAGLAAPASAAAAAGWSTPTTVSGAHDAFGGLQLASGPSGDLLAWSYNDLLPPTRTTFGQAGVSEALASPTGPFGAERRLPARYAGGSLVDLGEGHLARLVLRRTGLNTARPEVLLGTVGGRLGSPLRVSASVWVGRARLAGNSRGELLLAWISSPRSGRRQVWASVRPAGGRFGKPRLLSADANGLSVTAAIGSPSHRTDRGGFASDMAVVFDSKRGRMLARLRFHGSSWDAVQSIGPAAVGTANVVAPPYIGRDGRVVIAWYHQQLSEGGPLGPGLTQVAVRPAGAHRFAPAQTLARDATGSIGGETFLAGNDGHGPMLAFLAPVGGSASSPANSVVRVSYSHGNRFGPARTVSAQGLWASGLAGAEGPRGPIVTWVGGPNPPFSALSPGAAVYAALTDPATQRLGPPEQVSPSERAQSAVSIHSAAGGRWIVAWAGLPLYQSPSLPGPRLVRVSFCPEPCT